MAKQSQAAAARKRVEKLKKIDPNPLLPGGDPRDPRLALDFAENRELPAFPPEAYFFRRFVSLRDALQAYRAESPEPGPVNAAAAEMVPSRKKAIDAILAALGTYPFHYPEAEEALMRWSEAHLTATESIVQQAASPKPDVRTAAELRIFVLPLMWAYRDPQRFFSEVVERCYPSDFERLPSTLGRILHTWGYGALLNPKVREAMDALSKKNSSDDLLTALADAEGRAAYRDLGRQRTRDIERLKKEYGALPRGTGARARWLREKAAEQELSVETLRRYVRPSLPGRRA